VALLNEAGSPRWNDPDQNEKARSVRAFSFSGEKRQGPMTSNQESCSLISLVISNIDT
jgi:hypothetical protein